MKQRHAGITLLEMLLVLTIGVGIFIFGLRQYNTLRLDSDILEEKSNIDALFLAAAGYYQANCAKGGQLDPLITPDTTKAINIKTDLIDTGYLSASFPTPNPLVDDTGTPGTDGYVVQLNRYTSPRYQPTCSDPPACTTLTDTQIGTVVTWQIQVAVLMKNIDPDHLTSYKNYFSADCLAKATGSPATTPLCSTTPPTGHYIVFQRTPSYVMSDWASQSPYWLANPLLKQFNQMYTTNPIAELTSQDHTTEYQYFYCSS